MKIIVVFVYPLNGSGQYLELALRFLASYHEYPAGIEHELLVVCNGAPVTDETRILFSQSPCRFMTHDNSGFDIGAFQHAARENPCDLMVFFGISSYLKGTNWLWRMADAYRTRGPALFGTMGNRGMGNIAPHIRTTCMWMPPDIFNQYPVQVTRPEQRYPFEHGHQCLTSWVTGIGLVPYVVAWSGEYRWQEWDSFPNGFHRGDQSNMIAGDKHSCPPYYHCS